MSKIPVIFYKNFPPLYTKLKIGDKWWDYPVFNTRMIKRRP